MIQQDASTFGARFEAVDFGSVTCMGTLRNDFPIKHGNCFSVVTADGDSFRVVNFVYENLAEAIRCGTSEDRWSPGVAWPVQCIEIGPRLALIHDARIPTDWYRADWCETCCPQERLPAPQRLRTMLRRESGEETVTTDGGLLIVCSTTGQRIRLPGEPLPEEPRAFLVAKYETFEAEVAAKYAAKAVRPGLVKEIVISSGDES